MRAVVAVVVCTSVVVVGYKGSSIGATIFLSVGVGRGGSGFVANIIAVGIRVLERSVARFVISEVVVN